MATATLELINPYSKLGFKRRPTYDEIINLINENETITGQLPDRTATLYKASPEGSFFDGTDALELLKEQQNRILERQMQDLLLRQTVRSDGGTFNLERHRQNTPSPLSSSSTPISAGEDRGTLSVALMADLQRREAQMREREQQTGGAHAEELSRQSMLPTLDRFLSGMTSSLQRMIRPLPIPSGQPQTIDLTTDDVADAQEDFFPEEMTTARDSAPQVMTEQQRANIVDETPELDKKQEVIFFSLKATNQEASKTEFNNAFKVLDKFKDVNSGTLVRNTENRDEVFRTMHKSGYITQPAFNKYLELVVEERQTSGQKNKEKARNEMAKLYGDTIYNRYIAPISVRKGAETKAKARKSTGASSSTMGA